MVFIIYSYKHIDNWMQKFGEYDIQYFIDLFCCEKR